MGIRVHGRDDPRAHRSAGRHRACSPQEILGGRSLLCSQTGRGICQYPVAAKEGNIAHLLCEAIDCDEFKLCRKKSNLFKRNGIIWKEKKGVIKQVGIKQTALVQFIRNQNGYQNYSSRKITDYMKDIGCLTINEDKSNTVHLGKIKDGKRSLPRVLLIDVETLRDNAEKYELFAEQARE